MRRVIVTLITIIGSGLFATTARAQSLAAPPATFLPAQPLTVAPRQAPAPLPPPVFGQTPAKPVDAASLDAFRAFMAASASAKTSPVDCAMAIAAGDPAIDPRMPHEPKRDVTFLGRVIPVPPCPAKTGR
jgi:hypothetical protein